MTGSISHPSSYTECRKWGNSKATGNEKGIYVDTLSKYMYVHFPKGYN